MNKLLHKPFKAFTIYALLILAGSIPVYYFVVDFIWNKELDEHNQIIKERIETRLISNPIPEQKLDTILKFWNVMQPGTTLESVATAIEKDSIYTVIRQNKHGDLIERDRFRGLIAPLTIAGKPYRLTVETNVEETDETLVAIALVTFTFFSLLVIGFILLNKRIARRIWQPFQNTLQKLKSFDLATDSTIAFEKTNIEEFEDLNQTLTKLIDKNVTVYQLQKTFIENASHELQTPLAVLKSKMDLLLQQQNMTEKQLDILNAINIPLSRVTRINKNLLLLAKIENHQFETTETIALKSIVAESLEMLADYTADKGIQPEFYAIEAPVISGNRSLLEILINNLLTNAIRHNIPNGKLRVELNGTTLSFLNSGVTALHSDQLFQRFSVTSSETTNSGLGLAIVKEICNRYQWEIVYDFDSNMHRFTVHF